MKMRVSLVSTSVLVLVYDIHGLFYNYTGGRFRREDFESLNRKIMDALAEAIEL
jgi:hypothetical protein